MKKITLFLIALGMTSLTQAQDNTGLQLGAHVGIPVGDASNAVTFNFGADVSYLFNVAPTLQAGITSGYSHYLGKNLDIGGGLGSLKAPDAGIVPIAATGKYSFDPRFFFAADLGYAVFVNKDSDGGGFYYQPKIGYTATKFDLYAGYKGISNGGTLSTINLGINFKF
ncbi:hypothetical protein ORI89_07750 [Sphingobacterium sp. UT-1RO-CII-1]|uniref:hypothetical protein n=1 Tax=Sphingobacterium sp. UT-1RO-CII-1 TaxID=2995225 RepID=UPI00227ACADF|nr:hypothetical protein [Sphingobacterium sp. UT-1RO-CII-1]MCY4779540.1 hypothetical protein [Sphingobacterium sp. UT-1RO-CII-1]